MGFFLFLEGEFFLDWPRYAPLPRRAACPFPGGEASKEKNMSLREGLATALPAVAPLDAFPFCLPQGHLQGASLGKSRYAVTLVFLLPFAKQACQ